MNNIGYAIIFGYLTNFTQQFLVGQAKMLSFHIFIKIYKIFFGPKLGAWSRLPPWHGVPPFLPFPISNQLENIISVYLK